VLTYAIGQENKLNKKIIRILLNNIISKTSEHTGAVAPVY